MAAAEESTPGDDTDADKAKLIKEKKMDSSFETNLSDENDVKSDISVVTNTTINTLDGRSPVLFPSLHKYKKERVDQQYSTEGLCSPVIPVLDSSFLRKSIKQASQGSKDAVEDSDESDLSESLISTQTQRPIRGVESLIPTQTQRSIREVESLISTQTQKPNHMDESLVSTQTQMPNQGDKGVIVDSKSDFSRNLDFEKREVIKDGHKQNFVRGKTQDEVISDEYVMCSSPKQLKLNFHPNFYDNLSLMSDECKGVNPTVSEEMVDSQETYMPDVETNMTKIECERKEKPNGKSDKIRDMSENWEVLPQKINDYSVNNYEMVALTNAMINNEKLNKLDENNSMKEMYHPHVSCKNPEMEDDVYVSEDTSLTNKTDLQNEKGSILPLSGISVNDIQGSGTLLPQKLKHLAALQIGNHWQLSPLNANRFLASDETNFSTKHQYKGDITLSQHSSSEKPVSNNQNEMERGSVLSLDKFVGGSVLNDIGLLRLSQDTMPLTGETVVTSSSTHISSSGNSESNHSRKKDNMQISDTLDGSQIFCLDTQSSMTSLDRGNESMCVNMLMHGKNMKLPTNMTESNKFSTTSENHENCTLFGLNESMHNPTENRKQIKISYHQSSEAQDINIIEDKPCKQPFDTVSNEKDAKLTSQPASTITNQSSIASDKLVTPEEMSFSLQSKTSCAEFVNDDMEIYSDVEPSQMILLSTEQDKHLEKTRSDSQPSSQSSSSLSSLGEISSEDGFSYKKKEQHILIKIEKMQNKIQKKLTTATKKKSALDIDVTKQQIQAIKGILIKIAERHKIERNKLSLEVKKSSKSKSERTQVRENLMELSERQKSLYKLFQKHKEISSIIKNDVMLNECLASALVNDEKNSEKTSSVPKRSATLVNVEKNLEYTSSVPKRSATKPRTESTKTNKKKSSKAFEALDNTIAKDNFMSSTPETAGGNQQTFSTTTKRITNTEFSQADCSTDLSSDRKATQQIKKMAGNQMPSVVNICGSSPDCNNVALNKKTFETGKNYSVSLNGTQELYCDSEGETQIIRRDESRNLKTCSKHTQERELTPGDKISTDVGTQISNEVTACKGGPQDQEDMLKAMGLFTSADISNQPEMIEISDDNTTHKQPKRNTCTDITKKKNVSKTENIEATQKNGRIGSSVKISGHVKSIKEGTVEKNTQSKVFMSSTNAGESKKSAKLPSACIQSKDSIPTKVIYISPASMASASVVMTQPFKSSSESLLRQNVPLVTMATQKAKATYLSVPVSTVDGAKAESYTQTGTSSVTKKGARQNFLHKNSKVKISEIKNTGKLSSSQEKQKRKPACPGSPKTRIGLGEQMNTQNEMMKKVMDDAMRIINDRSVGNLKRPSVGIEHNWQSKQPRYTTEPWKPITTSVYKSPPYQHTDTARDISPSVASFTTFRSAFPERSPEGKDPQTQYLPEDIGPSPDSIFNGLKYPPLDMMIERQVLKPGPNVLSVHARNKEFKASLTDNGFIESKGGELFQTPVRWLAAVLGKPVPDVKKNRAYREVYYRGKPLMAYVEDPTLVPEDEIVDLTPEQLDGNGDKQVHSSQDSLQKLKDLLSNCTIKLLEDKDLVSDVDLPENFWTEDFSKVKLSYDLWKDVDKWD